MVYRVRCGTYLYCFLIFAFFIFSNVKNLNVIAKYGLSAEVLIIYKDRTKYELLSAKEYYSCKNTHMCTLSD